MDTNTQPVIYMVHNNGEYSAYAVLALFTDRALADKFAAASSGVVEEWPANVAPDSWCYGTARLSAKKQDGRWATEVLSYSHAAVIGPSQFEAHLGHFSGWGEPDPKTGQYGYGWSSATATTEADAKKICIDAFWKKVAEFDAACCL